jgi:hypothetical protein
VQGAAASEKCCSADRATAKAAGQAGGKKRKAKNLVWFFAFLFSLYY